MTTIPDLQLLAPLDDIGVPDAELMRTLHQRLAERAEREALLDIAYRVVPSPVGDLLVAATDAGVVRVAFASEGHDAVLDHLAITVSPRILRAGARLDPVARELDEYFDGSRRTFDVAVDLRLVSGFRREVLDHLREVRYGTTASYATLATTAGRPSAVRAAASACSHNPVPVVLPCHRIVRSDGSIGQYLGGAAAKRALLDLEAAG